MKRTNLRIIKLSAVKENCIMRTTFAPLDSGLSIGLSIPIFEKLGLTIISLTHAI